jgi:hypothetical protein
VGASIFANGLGGGGQRLSKHLAAEYIAESQILGISPENIFLDFFQLQQRQQFIQHIVNGHAVAHSGPLMVYGFKLDVRCLPSGFSHDPAENPA